MFNANIFQTVTPYSFARRPNKDELAAQFVGQHLQQLRTPAMIIDRAVFAENCAKMHAKAHEWGAGFRAHLKTHKVARLMVFRKEESLIGDLVMLDRRRH